MSFRFVLLVGLLCGCSTTVYGVRDDDDAGPSDASVPTTTIKGDASVPEPRQDAAVARDAALCDTFCTNVLIGCPSPYRDRATCLAICPLLPEGAPGDGYKGKNSIHCRLDPIADGGAHSVIGACYGTGPCGGDRCGKRCESFCTLAMAKCRAPYPTPFATEAECLTTCGRFVFDHVSDEYSDDRTTEMNCRQFHLVEAYRPGADVAAHCKTLADQDKTCQ